MAALLLAAGTRGKRVALSGDARITLHPPWRGPFDDGGSGPGPEMRRIHALVYETLAGLTGKTSAAVEDDARRRLTLDAAEARAYGLVDHVDQLPSYLA
jgi:ATP-dependent Clp protease protease subunit